MILIQRYLVLILVCFSLMIFCLASWMDVNLELAVLASSALTLVIAWFLERLLPFREEWRLNQGDLNTDIISASVMIGFVDPMLKTGAPLVVVAFYASLDRTPLLAEWSLGLQIILALLFIELGKYGSHRLHHETAPLWWLHAMHHSSERMYFLNGLRIHPLNYLFNFALSALPVMLLGISPEAILAYLAITQPVILLQHANIDLRQGWLNWVFSTPEAHRWHHSTKAHEANRNFGNAFLLWDHVFGTFKKTEGFDITKRVGLFASSEASYPGTKGYFAQLASLFMPPCCRA